MISDKNSIMQIIGCLMKNTLLFAQQDKYHFDLRDFDDLFTRTIFAGISNFYQEGATSVSIVDLDTYFQQYPDLKQEFDKKNGLEYLKDCETLCNPDNFDYYYNRLKKFSCLRALEKDGFDISEFYCENPLDKNYQKVQEKFDNSSVKEIFDSVKKKLSNLEKSYVTSSLNESSYASKGLKELISSFKIKPEIGPPLNGDIYNSVVQGARRNKYYLRSAGSGVGKTRLAVGDACALSIPFYYDWNTNQWIDRGHAEKVLFITTEVDRDEVQTMIAACVSGINERKILHADCTFKEIEVLDKAIEIIEAFEDNFILDKIPDPSISQIEACVRNHVLVDGVNSVFYDYIFSSPSLLNEFADYRLREDVVLFMLSTALKDLAVELNIFMSSSTQLSGDFKNQRGIRDQSYLRGSKAIADKADVGSIIVRICDEEKAIISPICEQLGLPIPTHVIDVYKNRRSEYNQIKIWSRIDLGTCREEDILITTGYYEPIKDFNMIIYNYSQKKQEPKKEEVVKTELVKETKDVDEVNEETPPFEIDEIPKVQKDKNIKKGKLADLL